MTTIVHPSLIKTSNIMMDSIISNKSDIGKKNLNNTITHIPTHMNYSQANKDKKQEQGRNWKNKSIENTPE